MSMENNSYKYILDSLSTLQLGSHYTYRELLDDIEISYKFRCIIKQYFLQNIDADTTLESHLYYMKPQDESCRIYQQLKARIRIYVPKEKVHRNGETTCEYEERTLKPEELASISPHQKEMMGIMISELQISKMGLMTFVV